MLRYAIPLFLLILALGCGGSPNPPTYPPPPPGAQTKRPAPAPAPRPAAKPPQEELTPEQRLDQNMAELTARLKLKPAQAGQVRAILARSQAEKDRLQAAHTATNNVEDMIKLFDLMAQVDRQTQAELAKVLSKDQMEAYQDYLKEQRKRLGGSQGSFQGKMPPRPGMGPGSRPNRP